MNGMRVQLRMQASPRYLSWRRHPHMWSELIHLRWAGSLRRLYPAATLIEIGAGIVSLPSRRLSVCPHTSTLHLAIQYPSLQSLQGRIKATRSAWSLNHNTKPPSRSPSSQTHDIQATGDQCALRHQRCFIEQRRYGISCLTTECVSSWRLDSDDERVLDRDRSGFLHGGRRAAIEIMFEAGRAT